MNAFSAVSDSTRRAMLDLLTDRPLSAGEIGSHFPDLTQPGVSKHLGVLKKAKLVKVAIKAQQRIYSLDRTGFIELDDWIRKYQKFWNENLNALDEYLNSTLKKKGRLKRK